MPKKDRILNLPGFTLQKVSGKNPLILHVRYRRKPHCPHCHHRKLCIKDSWIRRVLHHTISRRRTYLSFKAHKFYCYHCQRYFNEQFHGILKYQRATQNLKQEIYRQHMQGINQKSLATHFDLGKNTIERWYHQFYALKDKHHHNRTCPQVLGIDEHFFNKKQGYATTFCDLQHHRIFDVVKGKSNKTLSHFLNSLKNKDKVKVVCIDLSTTYRSIIKKYFPNALIVADRFHVIRLINHAFMKTYHTIDKNIKYQRGLLNALRTNANRLTTKRQSKREILIGFNRIT